ncbi:MAG: hypothetical protein WC222_09670 [Parachlamydiales bacterium]|jgi:hypothetical protein
MFKWWWSFLLIWTATLQGLDYAPWYKSPVLELDTYFEYLHQHYQRLDADTDCRNHGETSHFFTFGADISPWMPWNAQAEFSLADTTEQRSFYAKDFQLMGRYLLLDDVIGDPVSLSAGVTYMQFSKPAREDVGVFAHGAMAGEAHLAVGKEFAPNQFWLARGWALGGIGVGDRGAPWLRADAAFETNYCDFWSNAFVINSQWGLGHSLLCPEDFSGYGKLRYQFVDMGWKSESRFFTSTFKVGVLYRVYARNCPKNNLQLSFALERTLY